MSTAATTQATALAALFHGPGQPLELKEFAIPAPASREALVKITCSTICGSDLHTWHGRRQEPTPCVLGHEIVGTIVALGSNFPQHDLRGDALAIGDRITWTIAASCGECFFCTHEIPQKCEHLFKYGHNRIAPGHEFNGGFAKYCLIAPGTGVVKLPASLSDELAAPANCAVATVAAAHRLAGDVKGSTVVVMGCGVLGLNAIAMAAANGAAAIIGCDISEARAASAKAFGATHFALPAEVTAIAKKCSAGRGADVMLEFSGSSDAVTAGLTTLRTGGTAVIAGTASPGKPVELAPEGLVRRMLTLKGLHNYAPRDLVTAVDFLAANRERFPFDSLSGGSFPLEEIEAAFESASQQPGCRVAIRA